MSKDMTDLQLLHETRASRLGAFCCVGGGLAQVQLGQRS